MQLSYLLIQTLPGAEHEVGEELLKLNHISNVNLLYGKFDLIAKVNAESMVHLHEKVLADIQHINGVLAVKNLVVNHA
ncbi:MAG: Lrp/AsnC ligand binding domain-containing protein [Nanoarchaeota archaeon]